MQGGTTDRGNGAAKPQRQDVAMLGVQVYQDGWTIGRKAPCSRVSQQVSADHTEGFCFEPECRGTFCDVCKHGKGPVVFEIY